MNSRRFFLKTTLLTGAATAFANIPIVQAASGNHPKGIIYTPQNPGKWEKKIGSHAPVVKIKDGKVTIITNHGMSDNHYIVRHTLVTQEGEIIGEKTFSPDDEEAVSHFDLPQKQTKLIATSFCNKHDLWITEFFV